MLHRRRDVMQQWADYITEGGAGVNQQDDLDDRIRAVARVVVKDEIEAATRRTLDRMGMSDALVSRTAIERLALEVLQARVSRSEYDPISPYQAALGGPGGVSGAQAGGPVKV